MAGPADSGHRRNMRDCRWFAIVAGGGQRMTVRISSARGVSVWPAQAWMAAASASAEPAKTCGPPWRVSSASSELRADPRAAHP